MHILIFSRRWNSAGNYSAASAYAMMCEGGVQFQLADAIWKQGTSLMQATYVVGRPIYDLDVG